MVMSQQSLPPVNNYTGSFTEDNDGDGVRLSAFGHEDADIGFDPLSANRRFSGAAGLGGVGDVGVRGANTGDDIGDGTRLYRAAGERYRPSGSNAHHIGLSLGTGRRYDQLVTGREFSEVLVSGVPRRHIGTPATCILGRAQPNPQTVEKRQQQQLP